MPRDRLRSPRAGHGRKKKALRFTGVRFSVDDMSISWWPQIALDTLELMYVNDQMTAREFAAHMRLLCSAWINREHPCSLPPDDAAVAAKAGVPVVDWPAMKANVLYGFSERRGRLFNASLFRQFQRYLASPLQKKRQPRANIPVGVRFAALQKSEFRCSYCGVAAKERSLEVDHVVPVAKGGTNDLSNLVAACDACNAGKADAHLRRGK